MPDIKQAVGEFPAAKPVAVTGVSGNLTGRPARAGESWPPDGCHRRWALDSPGGG
jgi:hypothetical protein